MRRVDVLAVTNLGWFFTVFIFFQLFALYVYFRQPGKAGNATTLPTWYYAQAITTYAITGSAFILNYLSAKNRAVTDATGAVWQTINIYETAAIISLFTMIFIAALTAVKLVQQRTTSQAGTADAADTSKTPLAEHVG